MKFNQTTDFLYQLFTLIAAIIIVHAVYVAVIRPNAEALLEEQRIQQQAGESYEVKRSVFIVIKDFEQEACFILALWVVAIIGLKGRIALSERRLLNRSLLEVAPGATILPEDIRRVAVMSLRHRLQKDPLEPLESAARIEQALDRVFPLKPGDARAAGR